MTWPQIGDPLLRERLLMDDETFLAFLRDDVLPSVGRRSYTRAAYERGATYPWDRPTTSFRLRDGQVRDPEPHDARQPRFALLAIGSNGAPTMLGRKLAHLPDPAERDLLVQAGELHGFDVGVGAHPTAYGAMAATLFPSPATAVRAAVLHVTATQLAMLSWTELTYRLGRLDGVRFVADDGDVHERVLAYASRWGIFCPFGVPVALAAIPARGRTAPALTQPELLDVAARLAFGDGAGGEDLVRAIFADVAAFAAGPGAAIRAATQPFVSRHWTPFPG